MDLLTGTSGADAFYGSVIDDLGTGTTLNPGDNLNGGASNDALNLTLSGNPTSTFLVQTTSVEQINVGNYDTITASNATLSMASATGVTGVTVNGGDGNTLVTGLANLVAIGGSNATGNISVTYASGKLAGTDDTQAVNLNNFGLSSDSPTLTVADAGSTANIAETLALNVTGSNFVTLDGANNTKTITVAGAGNVTINANGEDTITKIDAATATGNVAVTGIGASKLTVTGGSGNDTLRIDGGSINADDSINAGTGTDKLQLDAAGTAVSSAANGAKLAGFETLEAYNSTSAAASTSRTLTQDVSYISGITSVGVSSWTVADNTDGNAAFAATDSATFNNLAAGTSLAVSGIRATSVEDGHTITLGMTVNPDLASDTTADSINVTLGTATAAATSVSGFTGSAVNLTLNLDDYETVNLTNQGGTQTVASITSGDLKTLTVNATKALTVTAVTASNLRTIDASASTADVQFNAGGLSLGGASTLTGGAGNDSLNGAGSADSISGGAGNDTLAGGGGNDTVNGGDGDDSIDVSASSTAIVVDGGAGNDSITGGSGNESINGGAGNDVYTISFTNLTSGDTVNGGDGTDSIAFTDNGNVALIASNASKISNLSSIERYTFANLAGDNDTVSVDDTVISTAGGSVTLVSSSNSSSTWDASGVLSNSSKTTVSFTSAVTKAQTVKVGNGIDVATLTTADDEVIVSTNAYLSSADTVNGGAGTLDTVIYTSTTGATITNGLTNVTGVERVQVSANNATADYVLTLTDAWLANNYNTTNGVFTVTVNDAGTDGGNTNKFDATAVGSSYNLWLDGASGNDTLIGGAGRDTIVATAGVDSLTGGAGNDTFVLAAGSTAGTDVITDLDLGAASSTSPTTVDTLNLAYTGITSLTVTKASGGAQDGTVVVMDQTAYATISDAEAALGTSAAGVAGLTVFLWQDTLGKVHLSSNTTGDTGSNGTNVDIATFSGLTVTDVAAKLTAADLSLAGLALTGSSEAETITGGVGNDTIIADGGSDVITGGAGSDTINVGTGTDRVVLDQIAGAGTDTITSFGSGDTLAITHANADGGEVQVTAAAAQGAFTTDRTYVIEQAVGTAASLTSGSTTTLVAADFTAATLTNLAAFLAERFTVTGDTQTGTIVLNIDPKSNHLNKKIKRHI